MSGRIRSAGSNVSAVAESESASRSTPAASASGSTGIAGICASASSTARGRCSSRGPLEQRRRLRSGQLCREFEPEPRMACRQRRPRSSLHTLGRQQSPASAASRILRRRLLAARSVDSRRRDAAEARSSSPLSTPGRHACVRRRRKRWREGGADHMDHPRPPRSRRRARERWAIRCRIARLKSQSCASARVTAHPAAPAGKSRRLHRAAESAAATGAPRAQPVAARR